MPSASTSLWRTYDALVGPLGTVAARMLVERLFAADRSRQTGGGAAAGTTPGTVPTGGSWRRRLGSLGRR
jgi:hypothetical protein